NSSSEPPSRPISACAIWGSEAAAIAPSSEESTGTSRQQKKRRPWCFTACSTMRLPAACPASSRGRKTIATPSSESRPSEKGVRVVGTLSHVKPPWVDSNARGRKTAPDRSLPLGASGANDYHTTVMRWIQESTVLYEFLGRYATAGG